MMETPWTPEEDVKYRIRNQYWHLLVFVDQMNESAATDDMYFTSIEVILKRIDGYDLSSTCNLPNYTCRCSGAGIRLRSQTENQ
jgi:hypothetical protein